MPKCLMVLPFNNGQVQFPGVDIVANPVSFTIGSYVPPPAGTAPYCLVWLEAAQSVIDTLTARTDCLYICKRTDPVYDADGNLVTPSTFETATINATARNAVRTKIAAMGFTGAQYGLLVAAINSSQNRAQLASAIATKAFFRDAAKNFMTDSNVQGTYQ